MNTDFTCDVNVLNSAGNQIIGNLVTYSHQLTSTITSFTPAFGPSTGNTLITFTGTNLLAPIQIFID
jgi:hypothetical protein